ncbi:MAG: class B sortase [Ruminococcus sp.]|nr:class B sortase [Ruminococcus sp.]
MYKCELISVKNNKADKEAITAAKDDITASLEQHGVSLNHITETSAKDIAPTVMNTMAAGSADMFIIAGALENSDDNTFRKNFYDLIRQLEERVVIDEDHKGYDAKLKINSLPDLGGAKGYCFSLCGARFIALPNISQAGLEPAALIAAAAAKADDVFTSLRDTCPEGVTYTDKNGQPADAELNRTVTLSELKPRKKQGFFASFFPQKEDTKKQKIRKIVVLIAIVVFIGALYYVLDFYIFGPMRNNAITSEIQSIAYNKKDDGGSEDKNGPAQDWDALKDINDEIVGWITIPDTVVDYPVLEHIGDDRYNQYYIDKSYKKDGTEFGSIFIDYRSTDSTKSRNVIMHGHNMRDGSQFHTMLNYSHEGDLDGDLDYYREHPVIIFNTPDGDAKYKIISVFKTSTRYEHGEFFNYMQGEFNSDAEFMNFVYNTRIRSMFDIPVTVNEKDQIITLSTCCYEFYQWRCVIVARKVRPGEDEKVDVDLADNNPDPLFPDVYYERYGGTRPDPGTFKKAYAAGKVSWYDGKGNLEGSEDLTATLAANPTEPPTEKPKPGETKATEPPAVVYYQVIYRNMDGSQFAAYNVKEGDPLPKPDGTPTMAEDDTYRYEFAGWNLDIAGVDFEHLNVGLDIYPIFNSIPKG